MGLVNWEWRGRFDVGASRSIAATARGMAALLASVATVALLTPPASAQQATQPTAEQQAAQSQKAEEAKPPRRARRCSTRSWC